MACIIPDVNYTRLPFLPPTPTIGNTIKIISLRGNMLRQLLKIGLWLSLTLGTSSLSHMLWAQQTSNTSELPASQRLTVNSNAFIRDDLFVFMHTGPTRNYRILGSIVAGEEITVLTVNEDTQFTQVKDSQDRVGWIEGRFLSTDLPAQKQLQMLSEQLNKTVALEAQLASQNKQLLGENEKLTKQLNALTQRVTDAEMARNKAELALQNADQSNDMQWLVRGGLIAGGGVLLGVLLTLLPKRRRREDSWM